MGRGGTLAEAGFTAGNYYGAYAYAETGIMRFDTADLGDMEANGTLLDVIKHEMAHVIGFGTIWTFNNVYIDQSGQYTGANALAQYKTEFNKPSATYVPVELEGGSGTADGHWDEEFGGANPGSNDFGYALMSGWLNSPTQLTNTTLGSFEDIGYNVNYIPEPKLPPTLAILGALWFASRRRRAKIRKLSAAI